MSVCPTPDQCRRQEALILQICSFALQDPQVRSVAPAQTRCCLYLSEPVTISHADGSRMLNSSDFILI